MKRIWRSVPLALLLCAAALPGYAATCSNNDFKGVYSATVTGSFISPPPGVPVGPTARVGRVQVDGNGVAAITTTLSLGGIILQESYGGTYTIGTDCVAAITLQIPFPGAPGPVPFAFSGVLADGGRAMDLLLLNPKGTDIRIVLRKQRRATCSANDLNGDYSLDLAGTVISWFLTPSGSFARVGKVTFDGKSSFTATVNTSYAGTIQPETFSGTYAMDPNCSFTAGPQATAGWSWFGVLADTVSGANLIVSTPGAVITGTLTSVN